MSLSDDDLDILIAEITTDAHDEDEQLWGFQAAMEDLNLPVDAQAVGEKVDLLEVHYDGNPKRGLVAVCKRKGRRHVVSLVDVVVDHGAVAEHLAAYRRWMGIDAKAEGKLCGRRDRTKAVDLSAPVEAVLLKVGEKAARIRPLDVHEEVTLRAKRSWAYVPGQILTIKPRKRWSFNNYPCMSGEITGARIDIPALGLEPITILPGAGWDPSGATRFHDDLADLWEEIASTGWRETIEFEWIVPGFDPDRDEQPPVHEANELYLSGDRTQCWEILADMLMKDLRCIEAHMLLGCWTQETLPQEALLHFEVAVAIIDDALGPDFEAVIPWDLSGDKSVLATLSYYAHCLWQLGRTEKAQAVFERLLWLNPDDPTDAQSGLLDLRVGTEWKNRTPTVFD